MIDLHTTATANGYRASILLEEMELPYRVRAYDLRKGEHLAPAFVALNPVGRLPVIVDHSSADPNPDPVRVYGSPAIALYLAEKSGKLMPRDAHERAAALEWLGIVTSDLGPAYSGQFTFNVIAPEKHEWAIGYYDRLCDRLVAVMERRLAETRYLAGDTYSIADALAYPTVATSMLRYPGDLTGYASIARWARELASRPGVQRGMKVPAQT